MFVGEPKRLSEPFPDPFLFKIPNMLFLGVVCFCDCGKQSVIEVSQRELGKCWHQGVIQAEQPRLVQGAGAVNVESGHQLSW